MKMGNLASADTALLRQKAEEKLNRKQALQVAQPSESDTMKLVHELELYQIELEMQGEELRQSQDKAKAIAEKYTALYENAYTGYFTIGINGKIFWLNQSGARMLGRERSKLVNKHFSSYITLDTLAVFKYFFLKVFRTRSKESCEARMIIAGNPAIYVLIEGILTEDEHKCLITLVDITKRKHAEEMVLLKANELKQINDLVEVSDLQMNELKKEINLLLHKLGEKEKFTVIN